ncbi:hypothetical protein PybrP1_008513 [[Pythium] brassicae (nom. inval.)]|nr:hypothetical protein PybrP1_008513 [[Pythium] brassicae (nom. inval.)]
MKRRVAVKRGTRDASHQNAATAAKKKRRTPADDAFDWAAAGGAEDVIASSESDDDDNARGGSDASDAVSDAELQETAQEKRVRLAKEYLDKVRAQEGGANDATSDEDEDADATVFKDGVEEKVSARLQRDALEAMGKLFRAAADSFAEFEFDTDSTRFLPGHRLPVTSVCLADDGKTAFSASKDGAILRWDLAAQTKTRLALPSDDVATAKMDHEKSVLALALSSDGKFLASGGCDKLVRVWDAEKSELLESFKGHRDAVTSLAFHLRSHSLLSGSLDRSIKHWNLTEMGYVETLFGHQGEVHGLDSLYKERVVSCGRDRSVRMWKIPEETQLVFYGNSGSMDCVKMVTDEYYVTGGDDGSLSLWFNGRKKPVHVVPHAHGAGKWVASVAVMPRTDLVASGSSDGLIRLWKADLKERKLAPVATIPVPGYVNALVFDSKARFLLAGVGQEHRLGRWERLKRVKNGIAIIALPNVDEEAASESESASASEDED